MQRHTVVPSWQGSPGYVDVVAKLVAEQLDSLIGVSDTTTVLFSGHGVPVSYVEEAGEPYKRDIEETVAKVTENVKRRRPETTATFELSFQSRVGPGNCSGLLLIRKWGGSGRGVVVVWEGYLYLLSVSTSKLWKS